MKKINFKNVLAGLGVCFILVVAGFLGLQTVAQFFGGKEIIKENTIVEDDLDPFLRTAPVGAYGIIVDDIEPFLEKAPYVSGDFGVIIVEDDTGLLNSLKAGGVKTIVEDDIGGFIKENPNKQFTFIVEDDVGFQTAIAGRKTFIVEDDLGGFQALVGKNGFIVEDDLDGFLKKLNAKTVKSVDGVYSIVEDDLGGF